MLLCFDYDGVISDSVYQLLNIAKKAQKKLGMGREPTIDDFKTLEYLTFDHFAKKIEIPESHANNFSDIFFEILNKNDEKVKAFPEIIDVLKKLATEHTIVIITANLKSTVSELLKEYGAYDTVSFIFDEKDPGDKTEKILKSIEMFKETKSNTLMIGDTISDIRYGKDAGVKTIAVTWGFHSKELLQKENPDFIADIPTDLIKIINNLAKVEMKEEKL